MRISSGILGMDSARLFTSSTKVSQSVETSSVSGVTTTGSGLTDLFEQYLTQESTTETEEGTTAPVKVSSPITTKLYNVQERNDAETEFSKLHQLVIQNILELIFGRRIKNKDTDIDISGDSDIDLSDLQSYDLVTTNEYFETSYSETECTSFEATGKVCTDDGREIDININIEMSRSFQSTYSECLTTLSYQCTDPLVINLSDAPASLSDMKFFFDLDSDGEDEEISKLKSDSGFLALDKNDDGVINNGSELFGTKTGNGFKDLAAYDEDSNGWIDENDSVFEKLKIWTKNQDGEDVLYTLKQKNIGAIALQSTGTQFSLNSKLENATNGYIRQTGLFLYEDGQAGTVQHVDLVS